MKPATICKYFLWGILIALLDMELYPTKSFSSLEQGVEQGGFIFWTYLIPCFIAAGLSLMYTLFFGVIDLFRNIFCLLTGADFSKNKRPIQNWQVVIWMVLVGYTVAAMGTILGVALYNIAFNGAFIQNDPNVLLPIVLPVVGFMLAIGITVSVNNGVEN